MCIMVSSICLLFSAGMVVGQTLKANSPQVPNSAHLALSDTVQEEWVQHYTSGIGVDYASAIAIDQLGNVYVTGKSEGYNSGYDYLTIKYDASGTEEWVARYNSPGSGDDEATAISVDADGNVCLFCSS